MTQKPRTRHLLGWLGLAVAVAATALWWTRPHPVMVAPAPVLPPVPASRPVTPVEAELPATATPDPLPATEPSVPLQAPTTEGPPLQSILLADGRRFIGTHDPIAGTIEVHAAIRGGIVTRMQSVTIRAAPAAITSIDAYDGSHGDMGIPYAPAPIDPARAAELAVVRDAAAMREEVRRREAAEEERKRQSARQRAAAVQRCEMARTSILSASQREQHLLNHARTLEDDRRQKRELSNGLRLQLNTAQDRWNLELQNLGPRVTKPDGTIGGAPTPATEVLVNNLQFQLQQAQQGVARAEQALRTEAVELQDLTAGIPQLKAELEAATAALAAMDP